jgi:hypothetical protein
MIEEIKNKKISEEVFRAVLLMEGFPPPMIEFFAEIFRESDLWEFYKELIYNYSFADNKETFLSLLNKNGPYLRRSWLDNGRKYLMRISKILSKEISDDD